MIFLARTVSCLYIHLGFDFRLSRRAFIVTALDRSWQPIASCSGSHSHLFFPPNVTERKEERERREIRAKSVCRICPVGSECLDYAMTIREPYGIWGGLTETERRQRKARISV
jgi:WhiB family redox-sensing transcriptional regulator